MRLLLARPIAAAILGIGAAAASAAFFVLVVLGVGNATVTGTATSATEAGIRAGGATIVINTLPVGETWVADPRAALLTGISGSDTTATGWNSKVTPLLTVANVVRTSDTLITITLPAVADYNILGPDPEEVTIEIPAAAITGAAVIDATQVGQDYAFQIASQLTVGDVAAAHREAAQAGA